MTQSSNTHTCIALSLILALAASGVGAHEPMDASAQGEPITLYRGAQVWTGDGFEPRDLAVRAGRLVDPAEVENPDEVTDLSGAWITPPLADAHNHVTQPADWASGSFLERGEFYVWNPTTIAMGSSAGAYFARPDTYDVKVSYGGITEPRGHPEPLYVDVLSERVYNGRKDFLGDAFHYGRDEAEIDGALGTLAAQGADFVKAYLLYSEEYELRREDAAFDGQKGIDPDNAGLLVSLAADRGLPVVFHVETASDLVTAARAGAFAAMHLPAYGSVKDGDFVRMVLREDQAETVARSGMLLTATYLIGASLIERAETDAERSRAAAAMAVQAHNLRMLRDKGARFLIGTDGYGSAVEELAHLASLDVFERAELLEIAFQTGPALFAPRRIGCLEPGCEADFLALEANPLIELSALSQIRLRVKAGKEIEAAR